VLGFLAFTGRAAMAMHSKQAALTGLEERRLGVVFEQIHPAHVGGQNIDALMPRGPP
jgi:hypothetical protein